VEKWLRGFYDARFVMTDSFHGMVLSIVFNKPFIVYGNVDRGMARFDSLLNDLNLKSRLVYNIRDTNITGKISDNIDWTRVNDRIKEMKRDSLRFLTSALSTK
jgi:exopolysaccharide biosynthesis predicted pyruvyltransferase EpsI